MIKTREKPVYSRSNPAARRRRCANRRSANRLAISVGLVTAVWLTAVSRWIFRDAVVPWDSKNQFYAFFRFLSATLRAGEWPFWNLYHYGGHPSVADPQSLVFSPVFVAWGLLDPVPTMRAFELDDSESLPRANRPERKRGGRIRPGRSNLYADDEGAADGDPDTTRMGDQRSARCRRHPRVRVPRLNARPSRSARARPRRRHGSAGSAAAGRLSGCGGGEVREVLDSIGDTCPECPPD